MQESKSKNPDQWTKVEEIRLFKWMTLFKPTGLHKHFHMMCLLERMNKPDDFSIKLLQNDKGQSRSFTASDIWSRLSKYYNLEKADEVENRPYEIEKEDTDVDYKEISPLQNTLLNNHDFELSWDEYGALMLDHAKETEQPGEDSGVEVVSLYSSSGSDKHTNIKSLESPQDDQKPRTRRALRTSVRLTRSRKRDISDGTDDIEQPEHGEDVEEDGTPEIEPDSQEYKSVEKNTSVEPEPEIFEGDISAKDKNTNNSELPLGHVESHLDELHPDESHSNGGLSTTNTTEGGVTPEEESVNASPEEVLEDRNEKTPLPGNSDEHTVILAETHESEDNSSISGEDTEEGPSAKKLKVQGDGIEEDDADSPASRTRRKSVSRVNTRLSSRLRSRK